MSPLLLKELIIIFLFRGVAYNVVEGKCLCNVFLTFKISVLQTVWRLQEGSRNVIEILGISFTDSNKNFLFKFMNAFPNADVISAIKTSTLGTLNIDLNSQCRKDKCLY